MISLNSADLSLWLSSFIWPLARILGLIAAAPLFGNISIPRRVKVVLGFFIAVILAPGIPPVPVVDPFSPDGMLIIGQQFVIGTAIGFTMRIAFAATELAGEAIGMTMGLGFATFYDPQSRGRSSALAQFLSMMILMIYISANFHLMMLSALAESFVSMPVSATPLGNQGALLLVKWAGHIFYTGLQLALPVLAVLLITNLALGILTRAAPQLNLFGIGFPITIGVGFLMTALALSYMEIPMEKLFYEVFAMIKAFTAPTPLPVTPALTLPLGG